MLKQNTFMLNAVHNGLWFSMTAYFLAVFFSSGREKPVAFPFLVLGLYFLVSSVLFEKVNRFWYYLVFEAAGFFAVIYMGRVFSQTAPFVLSVMLMLFLQIVDRIKRNVVVLTPMWQMSVYFGVTYFVAMYFECSEYMSYVVYAIMIEFILVVLDLNTIGLYGFLNVRKNIQNLPIEQIKRTNMYTLLGLLCAGAILFICTGLFMDNGPIYELCAIVRSFLKWLGQFIEFKNVDEPSDITQIDMPDGQGGDADVLVTVPEDGLWIPDVVMYVLAAAFVVAFVSALVIGAIKLIVKLFLLRREDDTVITGEENSFDVITELKRPVKEQVVTDKSPEALIRGRYKKEVLKKRKENRLYEDIRMHLTPAQIEKESVYDFCEPGDNKKRYWDKLHGLYEKARYSNEACTQSDVSQLNELSRAYRGK